MDHHFDKFVRRLDTFFHDHYRQFYPEERVETLERYYELVNLLEEEAAFSLEDENTSLTITITAKTFLSSKDFPALQDLIHQATTFDAKIQDGNIVFTLYFTFWKWIPKEQHPE